jgi:hypothetical protein
LAPYEKGALFLVGVDRRTTAAEPLHAWRWTQAPTLFLLWCKSY